LTNAWAANVTLYVGNYGEVFERNLGAAAPLAIPRGLNQLWSAGGIQYDQPMVTGSLMQAFSSNGRRGTVEFHVGKLET
jgi:hypothetical protein